MDLEPHVESFKRFADSFLTGDEKDKFIVMKREHSLRVLENTINIVDMEKPAPETARLCLLSALFHDIGRFTQFATYGTFNDRESINHGRMGVLTLRESGLPKGLTEREQRIVRFAVGQHNLKIVRPDLPPHLIHPVHMVRDADKLDIMSLMINHFRSESPDPIVTLGLDPRASDEYSDEVYQAVLNKRDGDYTLLQHANDFLLMLLGWIYSFQYAATLKLTVMRSYLTDIFSLLPNDEKIQKLKVQILAFAHYNNEATS